jgi:nitroreductase
MELLEGIKSRKSIRAFKPDPVSGKALMDLLELATWAPSGVNLQPWEFFVVRGKVLDKLKRANLEEYRLKKAPNPDIPLEPIKGVSPALTGVYRERQVELAKQIFQLMGITKRIKKSARHGMRKWCSSGMPLPSLSLLWTKWSIAPFV